MSDAMQNMIEASLHQSLEMGEMDAEIARLQEAIAKIRGEVSELLAASDADTMLMRDMDRELTRTKASLGRAVEALLKAEWSAINYEEARQYCPVCGGSKTEGHYQTCIIGDVLSDPDGEQANAQWVAMRECAEAACRWSHESGCQMPHANVWDEFRAAVVNYEDTLRCLKEVQKDA